MTLRRSIAGLVPLSRLAFPGLAFLLLTGCAEDNRRQTAADPLLGNSGPARPATGVAVAPPVPIGPAAPAPNSGTTPSNAALAAGLPPAQPLDPTHDLRIAGPNNSGAPLPAIPTANGAILKQPEMVVQPVSRRDTTLARGVSTGPRVSTFEQGQALLASRGIRWQQFHYAADGSEWKFTCSVPNRQNPSIVRTYEARAGTTVAAIQAVLDQMDREEASGG